MKRVLCALFAIILFLNLFDVYSLGHASNNFSSNNNYLTLVNDGNQSNSVDTNSSENSNVDNDSNNSNESSNNADDNSNKIEPEPTQEFNENTPEAPSDHPNIADDQTNAGDSENSNKTDDPDSTIEEEHQDEVIDSPSTNLEEEQTDQSTPTAPKDTSNQGNNVENPNQANTTAPIQKRVPLIDTLTKENMWANKTVYLTFDDGPSQLTKQVLDVLKEHNIKATFFVTGSKTDEEKALLKRIDEEGHAIGNHTYSHNYKYIYKHVDNFFNDLYKNEKIIYEATGKHTKIIRFPGGSNNGSTKTENGKKVISEIMDRLADEKYVYFDWNASSGDASPQPATVNQITNNVLTWVGKNNNAVVLFHDTDAKKNTLEALPIIVKKLRFLGCNFKVLTTSSPHVAFVKPKVNSNKKTVTNPVSPRKPPHVIRKLQKLEMRFFK